MTAISATNDVGDLPGISCLCMCYGRVYELEEAILSFLRQDYAGPKELVLLNDLDAQTLIFDHPEVKVINKAERYGTIGEKRQMICEYASYDLLCHWDDDDIYLSHRLDLSARLLGSECQFVKPTTAYFWNDGKITSIEENLFHVQACFRRELLETVGGYPFVNAAEDALFEEKIAGRSGVHFAELRPEQNFYLYRWGGVGHHLSGAEHDPANNNDIYTRFDREIRCKIEAGIVPTGDILLRPYWKYDYEQQACEFVASMA